MSTVKLLYLDCFAGISGDMFLGALLDLGVSEDALRVELAKLKLSGYTISVRRVVKQNISARKFDCIEDPPSLRPPLAGKLRRASHEHEYEHEHEHEYKHSHRGYTEIAQMITVSDLSENVKRRALSVFRRLGEAEAKIHGVPLTQIHFHEIGAIDSIVDIVGACVAVDALGVDEAQASPPRLGSGFVETAHGKFPVPAPATLELLKGVPTQSSNEPVELVTPTGAALLTEFCTKFGPMPAMRIEKVGYGAGSRDLEKAPNVLRVVLGEVSTSRSKSKSEEVDTVGVIETNIDDMNPQLFGDVMERLLAAGALDVFMTPVQMKKNRPGTLLTVLCERHDVDRMAELLLTHTTSFGVRIHEAQRRKLAREIVKVKTKFGEIEVKIGRLGDRIVSRAPEYESCKRTAAKAGVAVKEVYEEAVRCMATVAEA